MPIKKSNSQIPGLFWFIVPQPPVFTVTLPDAVSPITQHYKFRERSSSTIEMYETNCSGATLRYVFKATDRELTVESCTVTTASGEQIDNPAGYPYFRLPMSKSQPEEWAYNLHSVEVECIARLDVQEMDGKPCEIIHLSRMFHYRERQKDQLDMIIERYAAGHGIYHRLELSNLKINGNWNTQN